MNKRTNKPFIINAIIIVGVLLFHALTIRTPFTEGFRVGSGLFLVIISFVNLILGVVQNRRKSADGPVYLMFSGLVLLIGFSLCSGII